MPVDTPSKDREPSGHLYALIILATTLGAGTQEA